MVEALSSNPQTTCTAALASMSSLHGLAARGGARLFKAVGLSEATGAALGAESLSTLAYALPGPAMGMAWGISFNIIQQIFVTKKLAECIDTEEGYYIHYFVPAQKENNTSHEKSLQNVITQGTDAVNNFFAVQENASETSAAAAARQTVLSSQPANQVALPSINPVQNQLNKMKDSIQGLTSMLQQNQLVRSTGMLQELYSNWVFKVIR